MNDRQQPEDQGAQHNPWKRLSRRVAYENPWIIVYHDEVLRPDGQPGIYGTVHYRNRAVAVAPLDTDNRVLLVGQYRYTLSVYSWEVPEGGAPEGEEPLVAAQRELAEETGFSAKNWQLILRAHLSNSVSDEEAFCYLATNLQPGQACPEGTEELRLRWVPLAEALDLIARGEITDALSIMTLQQLALRRLQESRPD